MSHHTASSPWTPLSDRHLLTSPAQETEEEKRKKKKKAHGDEQPTQIRPGQQQRWIWVEPTFAVPTASERRTDTSAHVVRLTRLVAFSVCHRALRLGCGQVQTSPAVWHAARWETKTTGESWWRGPVDAQENGAQERGRRAVGGIGRTRALSLDSHVHSITDLPSRIMFEISLFPNNVPLPAPQTSGWLIGISMHVLHLCVRISRAHATSESEVGWEDLYWERSQQSWFDWVGCHACATQPAFADV